MSRRSVRPSYEEEDEEYLESLLQSKKQDDEDDFDSISFGALNDAQKQLSKSKYTSDSDSESDSEPEVQRLTQSQRPRDNKKPVKAKKNKHAPSESSSKKPVSKIRSIPGLDNVNNQSSLYTDIRFNAAYGKADLNKTRQNYAFLDEYRDKEIKEMEGILKNKKLSSKMSYRELEDIKQNLQSLKSRVKTLKNRDVEHKILKDFKHDQMQKIKDGKQVNQYYLKKSEQRKMIQKYKFDNMKASDREKTMERKRKKRLGKEFKQLEFRQNQ